MVSPGLRFLTGIAGRAGRSRQNGWGARSRKIARTRSKPAGYRRLAAYRLLHGQPGPVDDEVPGGWDAASVKAMASGPASPSGAEIALTASAFRS